MSDSSATIDRYLAAYGEPDGPRRQALIAETFSADATVADPPLDATGRDGIDAMFAAVQSQFPNHAFRRVSGIDEHHQSVRYEWELVAADSTVSVAGMDFVNLGDDGLITSVVGFFGPVPRS